MRAQALSTTTTALFLYGVVNCFLVKQDDGLTLIDTSLRAGANDILGEINKTGLPLTHILLTHAHMDHVGSLDAIMASANGQSTPTPLMGSREAELYHQAQRGVPKEKFALYPDEPQTPVKGDFPACLTPIKQTLKPGDAVGSLRCVASPGHTPGHVCFLDERDGTLFAGDALVTIGGVRVAGDAHWFFPLPNFATWHKPTSVQSARNLAALQPEVICAGHGKVVTSGVANAMKRALDSAESKLEKQQ